MHFMRKYMMFVDHLYPMSDTVYASHVLGWSLGSNCWYEDCSGQSRARSASEALLAVSWSACWCFPEGTCTKYFEDSGCKKHSMYCGSNPKPQIFGTLTLRVLCPWYLVNVRSRPKAIYSKSAPGRNGKKLAATANCAADRLSTHPKPE